MLNACAHCCKDRTVAPPRRRAIVAGLALVLPMATMASGRFASHELPHPSASISVSNCDDSGAGSLRDAVAGAASGDMIDLSSLTCSTITLTSGAIEIPQDDLYIKYSGEGGTPPTIAANLSSRVFDHTGAGTLKLVGLTIEQGKYDNTYSMYPASAVGGCIYSTGNVYLVGSTVTMCKTNDVHGQDAAGGAIYVLGALTLSHSTVSGSTAYSSGRFADGGGAFTHGAAYLDYSSVSSNGASGLLGGIGGGLMVVSLGDLTSTIYNSTIDGNQADRAGGLEIAGIATDNAAVAINNSTISGNIANSYAAAGYFRGSLTLTASTIAFNQSSSGPGIELAAQGVPITIESSIIANNGPTGFDYDIGSQGYAVAIGGSHSLVMNAASGITLPADTIDADPQLQPLADNGGQTRTHALGDGSPAIDAGDDTEGSTFDQRGNGFSRVVGAFADIGAFERQSIDDTIFADGFDGGARALGRAVP
jgi:hypothetical protein